MESILRLRPDVVLSERCVSGLALEQLERAGVVVASEIKHAVIARLAWLTGASVVSSVEALHHLKLDAASDDALPLGTCGLFRVRLHQESNGLHLSARSLDV